jgi:hypothetical protein
MSLQKKRKILKKDSKKSYSILVKNFKTLHQNRYGTQTVLTTIEINSLVDEYKGNVKNLVSIEKKLKN